LSLRGVAVPYLPYSINSPSAHHLFAARADARRTNAVRDRVGRLLAADAFDLDAVAWLAGRDQFSTAANTLAHHTQFVKRQHDPIEILLDPQSACFWPWRLGLAFGAFNVFQDKFNHPVTTANLQQRARSKDKRQATGARKALAALGEIEWSTATRDERAVYVLARLCHSHRERGP
jgi:hypothetical protein